MLKVLLLVMIYVVVQDLLVQWPCEPDNENINISDAIQRVSGCIIGLLS